MTQVPVRVIIDDLASVGRSDGAIRFAVGGAVPEVDAGGVRSAVIDPFLGARVEAAHRLSGRCPVGG